MSQPLHSRPLPIKADLFGSGRPKCTAPWAAHEVEDGGCMLFFVGLKLGFSWPSSLVWLIWSPMTFRRWSTVLSSMSTSSCSSRLLSERLPRAILMMSCPEASKPTVKVLQLPSRSSVVLRLASMEFGMSKPFGQHHWLDFDIAEPMVRLYTLCLFYYLLRTRCLLKCLFDNFCIIVVWDGIVLVEYVRT